MQKQKQKHFFGHFFKEWACRLHCLKSQAIGCKNGDHRPF